MNQIFFIKAHQQSTRQWKLAQVHLTGNNKSQLQQNKQNNN